MKYIKTFEKIRDDSDRLGLYVSYLYPVFIDDLPKMIEYLKLNKIYFDLYENGVKFLRAKPPLKIKDFLLYFEEIPGYGNKVNLFIKKDSLKFKHKSQISKWVGAKIKDIDLYINANKYNL